MRIVLAGLSLLLLAAGQEKLTAPGKSVVVVQIVGPVDTMNLALVERAARVIREKRPDFVLFEIDTPGGRVDHMLAMGEVMMSIAPIPTAAYVRPISKGEMLGAAWSAGAYLAMSCKKLYMAPGTVIGAAAPITSGPDGKAEAVGEKFVSALREKFRARAEQNGYPPNLAVAMVDKDLEVYEVEQDGRKLYLTQGEIDKLRDDGKKIKVSPSPFDSKDKILTLTDRQVAETGMGKIAETRAAIYSDYGLGSPVEEVITASWSERLAGFLTSGMLPFLLLVVGVLGIWVEFKTPGFGAAGVVGILAIGLFLFGHHLAGMAQMVEILLVVLGIGLVAVELFLLPGVGIFAIAGVLCVLAGLILSLQDFVIPDTKGAPWQTEILLSSVGRVLFGFVAGSIGFMAVLRFLPKVPMLNRLVLQAEIAGTAPAPVAVADLSGRQGHAATMLRPGGKVEIDGQLHDVVAEGEFIAQGEPIEILRVEGMRIVVGKLKR